MNNLHRELAPISNGAWAQIEEEASRTLKRHLAARRVVDVEGPKGLEFPAVGTGHIRQIEAPGDGIQAAEREVKALVEFRVPFELTRHAIAEGRLQVASMYNRALRILGTAFRTSGKASVHSGLHNRRLVLPFFPHECDSVGRRIARRYRAMKRVALGIVCLTEDRRILHQYIFPWPE
jgi:Encapsulating protein for peroxidase